MPEFTNKLVNETSPYLLQHAHNPVDWYPWGEEAFEQARNQNKPIFLSIGYSSCHWCHVMEQESFENEEVARVMNENFINIKVDREERPDVDQVYMQYVQMTTGSGGWPMSIFLTADKKPYYGGTYFPPQDAYGRPGFIRLLKIMANYFQNEKEKLQKNITELENIFLIDSERRNSGTLPGPDDWQLALQTLSRFYEPVYGGIGKAPKFPAVSVFNLFLRHYRATKDNLYLDMTVHTLKNMANGGIYDQVGGGFARYSVDERWLVPHFEKMLYDNGLLVSLYLNTFLVTRNNFFLNIAEETLAFILREMTSFEGGFYSSLDADSEGEEGKYYVWSSREISNILGVENAAIINAYYDVSETGNFEGKNILSVIMEKRVLAEQYHLSIKEVEEVIQLSKKVLLKEREKRVHPELDDKIIASWNGLMLSGFAKAYQVTRKQQYADIIIKNFSFIKKYLMVDGKLKRSYKNGQAKYDAFIEDYAYVIQALLDSYEAIFDPACITLSVELINYANNHFWDFEKDGYFTTSDNQEKLIKRMKDAADSSIPGATGVMLLNNLRLFSYTGNKDYYSYAEKILRKYSNAIAENPYSYASYLEGVDFFLEKPREILIVRNKDHDINPFLEFIYNTYLPNKIVMVQDDDNDSVLTTSLTEGKKSIDNKITCYVCQNFSCSLPVFAIEDLQKLLNNES